MWIQWLAVLVTSNHCQPFWKRVSKPEREGDSVCGSGEVGRYRYGGELLSVKIVENEQVAK